MTGFTDKQIEYLNKANHRWNIKHGATRSGKTYLDYYIIRITRLFCWNRTETPSLTAIIPITTSAAMPRRGGLYPTMPA